MELFWHVCRVALGLLLMSSVIMLGYKAMSLWQRAKLITKLLLSVPLLVSVLLGIDNGGYLVAKGADTVQTVSVVQSSTHSSPKRVFLLFHGYNGHGKNLVEILGPYLSKYGTVVAFEPSSEGYDNNRVIALTREAIRKYKPDELIAYGESLGGMTIADLLREEPGLHFRGVVLNAAPNRVSQVKLGGKALNITRLLHGGPYSTLLLREWQKTQVGPLPSPGDKETAADRADRASLEITAPTAIGEVLYMAEHTRVKAGEFRGRVDNVVYIHAPGSEDSLIKTHEASAEQEEGYGSDCFTDVPMSSWGEGEHTPTPRRAPDVVKQLKAVAGIAA